MSDDLDAQLRRTDPDRWLSSRFIADPQARADVVAIYAYDGELARAPRVASNALLGEMRLTWWREALDEIYGPGPVRHHPVAEALALAVARRTIRRAPLETMIDARYRELDAEPFKEADALAWAGDTSGTAAEVAVGILDPAADPAAARPAGAAWALARHAALRPLMERLLAEAEPAVRSLSVAAFPAVAHAALAAKPASSELGKRLRITWAVARGRI